MTLPRKVLLTPAFILHRRNYRNTSLLLDVLTEQYGRVGLVAKGVCRPRSRLQGLLQVFRPLLISWSGKGELGTLIDAEANEVLPPPEKQAMFSGFYVNEIVQRLLPQHDPHPAMFAAYVKVIRCIHGLEDSSRQKPTDGNSIERALRLFEKDMLKELGYGLMLDRDTQTGEPIKVDSYYCYIPEQGPREITSGTILPVHLSGNNDTETGNYIKLRGKTLLSLANGELSDPGTLLEAKKLLRNVLKLYLGDRPLYSRTLFSQFARIDHSDDSEIDSTARSIPDCEYVGGA